MIRAHIHSRHGGAHFRCSIADVAARDQNEADEEQAGCQRDKSRGAMHHINYMLTLGPPKVSREA